ncbi:MAG: Rpn family recombination-promoting nuclease/putative transposase [Muribaculaceae bacterium]|nr:Rpn family recombination-promoting nuclease/putative transposase [Muribaculaceae bacterium]MCM1559760.1 Rpn family recombination-promoting nuclease/putative transposase [Butyrivibrio sp.]
MQEQKKKRQRQEAARQQGKNCRKRKQQAQGPQGQKLQERTPQEQKSTRGDPQRKRQSKPQAERKYKDTVFRMLFREKENLLELYNAVSGKSCTDPELLEIVTLENAIYMGVKNDLAFLVDLHLYLYEHQSTVNLNMPFRFLQYVTEEYGKLSAEENIYGSRRIPLPAPHFVVFYNGRSPQPEKQAMKLSDAFRTQEEDPQTELPQMELRVLVLNINEGYNTELKQQCRTLGEYMQYVDRVRGYASFMSMEEAVDRAVDECIREGILRKFLLANKAEVKRMSIYEYDEEATRQAIREEEYERGVAIGMKRGREQGMEALVLDNIESGFGKETILAKLVKRFEISRTAAEGYYQRVTAALPLDSSDSKSK